MSDYIRTLRDAGIVTLDVDLTTGSYEDRSVYNNVVSANGTPTWVAGKYGWGMRFKSGQYLTTPNSVHNNSPKTVAVIMSGSLDGRIFSKNDAVGIDLDVYTLSGSLFVQNVVGTSANTRQSAFVAVTAGCTCYSQSLVQTTTARVASGAASGIYIGDYYAAGNRNLQNSLFRVISFNKSLTSTEAQTVLNELLSMRRSIRAYSFQRQCQTKQIGTPALHWVLDKRGPSGQYEDISGSGRHATVSRAVATTDGAAAFAGNTGSSIDRTDGLTETIGGNDTHVISFWSKPNNVATTGPIFVSGSATGSYYFRFDNTLMRWLVNSNSYYWTGVPSSTLQHIALRKTSANAGELYINGKLRTPSGGSLGAISATPGNLIVGGYTTTHSNSLQGTLNKLRIFSSALDVANIRKLYLEGSRITSRFNLNNIPTSMVKVPANLPTQLTEGLWVKSGSACIEAFSRNSSGTNVVTDGDMEAVGTASWTVYGSATLSKETPGYAGNQKLRIVRNGGVGGASQVCLTSGKRYRVRGYAKSDGVEIPIVGDGNGISNYWTGVNTTTDWQYFDVIITAYHASLFVAKNTSGSGYVEFDNIEVIPIVGIESKAITSVAGNNPIIYWKDNVTGGSRRFSFFSKVDYYSTSTKFYIGIASVAGSAGASGQNGYWIRFTNNTLQLSKSVAGSHTILGTYSIPSNTWLDVHWSWEFDGIISIWISPRGLKQWTLLASVVDTTVTAAMNYGILVFGGFNNYITDELITNEIALTPQEWDSEL